MADVYVRTLLDLRSASAWIRVIPADLLRTIREMYPSSYTFEHMRKFAKCMRNAAFCQGSMMGMEMYIKALFKPKFREFLLFCEARKADKIKWWAVHYSYLHGNDRPIAKKIAVKLHGEEFWQRVMERWGV